MNFKYCQTAKLHHSNVHRVPMHKNCILLQHHPFAVLWIRLKNNPDWYLKPIDSNIQEFVWKKLLSLEDVRWYDIKQPRKIPPIFSSFEDFYAALENDLIQVYLLLIISFNFVINSFIFYVFAVYYIFIEILPACIGSRRRYYWFLFNIS